jgi:hypothetical protein
MAPHAKKVYLRHGIVADSHVGHSFFVHKSPKPMPVATAPTSNNDTRSMTIYTRVALPSFISFDASADHAIRFAGTHSAAAHSVQDGVGLSPLSGSSEIERKTDGFADCSHVCGRKASN